MDPCSAIESLLADENAKTVCSRFRHGIEKCYEDAVRHAIELTRELKTREENIHKEEDGHE